MAPIILNPDINVCLTESHFLPKRGQNSWNVLFIYFFFISDDDNLFAILWISLGLILLSLLAFRYMPKTW